MRNLLFRLRFSKRKFGSLILWVRRRPLVPDHYEFLLSMIQNLPWEAEDSEVVLAYPSDVKFLSRRMKIVLLQIEHTLVRKGGRDSAAAVPGQVSDPSGSEALLVRLNGDLRAFEKAHTIIDYSPSNVINVLNSSLRKVYDNKAVYIAPLINAEMTNPSHSGRDYSRVFTSMNIYDSSDRRMKILDQLSGETSLSFENISGQRSLWSAYSGVGILLNLHQTDHHLTLEELRVLPALLQGVLVVSENSPLSEVIPYREFVTFADASDLSAVLTEVARDPVSLWKQTFEGARFSKMVRALELSNREALLRLVR